MNTIAGLLNPILHLANIRRPKLHAISVPVTEHPQPIELRNVEAPSDQRTICSVPACGPAGFAITAWADSHGVRVCFGGLEQDFDSVEEAMRWIRRALTSRWRLRIEFCGRRPFQWTLEPAAPGDSKEQLSFGYPMLGSSFQRKWTVYRYNTYDDLAISEQLSVSPPAPEITKSRV